MQLLRRLWHALVRSLCVCGRVTLLLGWLLLLGGLWLQLHIATLGGLELPDVAKQELQARFAASGLRIDFAHARFDTSGHLLIEKLRLGGLETHGDLLTARRVRTQLSLWQLLVGRFDLPELRIYDASLFVPAKDPVATPAITGVKIEPVAKDIDLTMRLMRRDLIVPQLTAQVGAVAVNIHGTLRLPGPGGPPPDLRAAVTAYIAVARGLLAAGDGFGLLKPRIEISLTPSEGAVALANVVVTADGWPSPGFAGGDPSKGSFQSGPLRLTATVPLLAPESDPVEISGFVERPALPWQGVAANGDLSFVLRGDFRHAPDGTVPGPNPTWLNLALSLDSIVAPEHNLSTGPVNVTVTVAGDARWSQKMTVEAAVMLADEAWAVKGTVNPTLGSGLLDLSGSVSPALLALAGQAAGLDLGRMVRLDAPLALRASVTLADGWKPDRAEGWFSAGPAVADGVVLEAAESTFTFAAGQLLCPDAMLRTPTSTARGSYEMDVATRDYRFLLNGHLRPSDIDGWFDESWPRFWQNFRFAAALPEASADVRGRWGSPRLTTILVAADVAEVAVRGVPLDRVRVRVFLAENWNDIREFSLVRGPQTAQGAFAITEAPDSDRWLRLEFSATSDLELETAAKLIGPDAEKFVQPYRFATPPHVVLAGILDGQTAMHDWTHERVDLIVTSSGDFAYDGFLVHDLVTQVQIRDDVVELAGLKLRAGGGDVAGNARLWTGAGGARRLSFDGRLTGANLGETIRLVENYRAAQRGEPAPAMSKIQQQVAAGALALTFNAEGEFGRPLSFRGQGNATITGADLAQINLLGLLSKLLDGMLLNFSSLSLDTLHTGFTLEGGKVTFPDLVLTGAAARLDASGDYRLDAGTLDFRVNVRPFAEAHTVVGKITNVITNPLTSFLEVKLQGPLENPEWVFVNGPSNLLRSLVGEKKPAPPPAVDKKK